jgi:hypothetical protein
MKTIDLSKGQPSLSEVLSLARTEALLIRSATGEEFLLEPADDFDREAAALGSSQRFIGLPGGTIR